MVMVYIKQLGKECYLDELHRDNLDGLKQAVEKKWDGVGLYVGHEGDGKTTKAGQDLAYLDENFSLENVCFTLEQVKHCVDTLPPGSAIMYDESRKDTNSSASKANLQEFIRIMTENRYKRFYWAIVSSTFFDLSKYFAVHRTRYLVKVYANQLERGFFEMYGRDKKQNLYIRGRKDWNWRVETPDYRARFTNWTPWDEDAYDRKKRASTKAADDEHPEWPHTPDGERYIQKQGIILVDALARDQFFKHGVPLWQRVASHFGKDLRTILTYRQQLHLSHPSRGKKKGVVQLDMPRDARQINIELNQNTPGALGSEEGDLQ